uniref:C2H2-type domain-containing protein n=1 Tax=Arundo donax TaxID=35708 RepID=A0A0A9CTN3_ARUDO
MVEPGRSAAAREAKKTTTSTAAAMKKKLMTMRSEKEKESSSSSICRKQSSHCTEPESPSYRLALKSLFSCRNSHGHSHHHTSAPDGGSRSKKLGCSAPSICKLKDNDSSHRVMQNKPPDQLDAAATAAAAAAEPCKRRASVSGSSERCVKKPLSEVNAAVSSTSKLHGGGSSLSSSSSSTGGGSFRAGMQLRRLSGCYECHMVVDPISGVFRDSSSMRTTILPCPDCGEIFVRQESLQLHQSVRHAVLELGAEDTSRNIIEIIFQSSWLKKQSPVCKIDRILKVHNTARTLARFEEYRDTVKARAGGAKKHPRCTADGNELLRFHCATLACSLGLHGATDLCDAASSGCAACGIIRDGFRATAGDGIWTMATSGRAHDAVPEADDERRAMLVCRVIAGRVKRPQEEEAAAEPSEEQEYDSVAGSAGVYSNLEELQVFNPRAILPCFVVVYKA